LIVEAHGRIKGSHDLGNNIHSQRTESERAYLETRIETRPGDAEINYNKASENVFGREIEDPFQPKYSQTYDDRIQDPRNQANIMPEYRMFTEDKVGNSTSSIPLKEVFAHYREQYASYTKDIAQ
jgi:hypothetical protein